MRLNHKTVIIFFFCAIIGGGAMAFFVVKALFGTTNNQEIKQRPQLWTIDTTFHPKFITFSPTEIVLYVQDDYKNGKPQFIKVYKDSVSISGDTTNLIKLWAKSQSDGVRYERKREQVGVVLIHFGDTSHLHYGDTIRVGVGMQTTLNYSVK